MLGLATRQELVTSVRTVSVEGWGYNPDWRGEGLRWGSRTETILSRGVELPRGGWRRRGFQMDEVGECVKANREDAGRGTVSWGRPWRGRREKVQSSGRGTDLEVDPNSREEHLFTGNRRKWEELTRRPGVAAGTTWHDSLTASMFSTE